MLTATKLVLASMDRTGGNPLIEATQGGIPYRPEGTGGGESKPRWSSAAPRSRPVGGRVGETTRGGRGVELWGGSAEAQAAKHGYGWIWTGRVGLWALLVPCLVYMMKFFSKKMNVCMEY